MNCPTCGSPVRVIGTDEGTQHYEPAAVAPLTSCPDCGHDVDHTTPCPDGCPLCPAADPAGANLDVEALAAALFETQFLRKAKWDKGSDTEAQIISAAYADAIRKRGGA